VVDLTSGSSCGLQAIISIGTHQPTNQPPHTVTSHTLQGFTNNPKPETLDWYRAAELKHGRVAMLAALGQIVQHFWTLPDPSGVFSAGDKPFEALNKVC
jgi:hypothetical protein